MVSRKHKLRTPSGVLFIFQRLHKVVYNIAPL
ncbi:hypothetical protein [Shigella phage ESh29]|nr:hypothetical protein [Shigella phage ESh29]